MENFVSADKLAAIAARDPSAVEKVFVLICRYWREADKRDSESGQVYFILSSVEKDRMFKNIMERLRKEQAESLNYTV